ncbi:caspase domain-containing protein [Desarmillaria tabescens]|uniref:Caspase domain-containing protein n=1 Tax=Armillaria tabescens TaxID=1929756 RepID=A0AA39NB33_ARMTA|nr:caspase domain-containing protein [Desarmillaria tabescens]KAK0462348.1 caspase domain-containing protein [Desarmillaria tabescens]
MELLSALPAEATCLHEKGAFQPCLYHYTSDADQKYSLSAYLPTDPTDERSMNDRHQHNYYAGGGKPSVIKNEAGTTSQSTEQPESLERKRALCIGINYYDKENRLKGYIKDATNIRGLLMQNGYKADDVKMLTDDTDNKPTKKNILEALLWLVKDAQSKDSLFLHYSGHGGQIADKNGDEIDGSDEDIECSDSYIIIDDEIHEILKSLPSGCRLTALFDTCHSGTVLYDCLGHCRRVVKASVSDRPVTGRLLYMGASSRYIYKTTCTTEFKFGGFIFADNAPS